MTDYQLTHLSLSTRCELVFRMLDPFRSWGSVTDLAREYGVSRKFLYELSDKASVAISEALVAKAPGRKPHKKQVEIDDDFVRRAIAACLSVVPGTVRTVQMLLDLLFNVRRSVGYISQTAKAIGAEALAYTQKLSLPILALAEADEIFQGHKPCLTVVDGRSFLVLSLSAQDHRDETTWGCVLLDIQKQGVQLVDVASDGGRSIPAGVRAISKRIPLRPDLFHLIRDAHRVTQRLERHAYKAMALGERARKAAQEQAQPKRRPGAPLKVKVELPQAEIEEQQAIETLDAWTWLLQEMRQALEPIHHQTGCIASTQLARQTLLTALELLKTIHNDAIQNFVEPFAEKLDQLLSPLEWLEQALAPWRVGVDPKLEAFMIWAWKHQKELGITVEQVLPADQLDLVTAFWNALSLFHRSSSLAESLHSWLRPYLQVHRGMPAWLLPLLQVVWNQHVFQRGKRQGKSPMQLAGLENVPALSQLFDQLVTVEKSIPLPPEFLRCRKSVTQFL